MPYNSTIKLNIEIKVDHSFTDNEMVKCRIDFINLAGSLTQDEEKRIKAKSKKAPRYTGEGAVDISKYLN